MDYEHQENIVINGLIKFPSIAKDLKNFPSNAFSCEFYRRLFSSIQSMANRGIKITVIAISIDTNIPITELINYIDSASCVDMATFQHCFKEIHERHKDNYLLDIARSNMSHGEKLQLINSYETKFTQNKNELTTLWDIWNEKEELEASGYFDVYLKTGIPNLDECFKVFREDLIVIGARPGVGKSALGIQIVASTTKESISDNFIFFNLEMSRFQALSRFNLHDAHLGIQIKDASRVSISEIRNIIEENNPKMIVIDQLNKIQPDTPQKDIRLTYVNVMCELKSICKETGIVIILLAQLNRATDNETPKLSDFKESGSIEEEADIVILLGETGVMNGKVKEVNVIVAKYRNGYTTSRKLWFDGEKQKFY